MTGDPPLWGPGWDIEPCDTAIADEQAFVDLHGQPRPITADHARPPGRPDAWRLFKPVVDVITRGDLL